MNIINFIRKLLKNENKLTNENIINNNILSKQELIELIKEFKLTDEIITEEMKNNLVLNLREVETAKLKKVLRHYIVHNYYEQNKLKEELEILDYVEKTTSNREKLLEKIRIIELKYKLFKVFDDGYISKEELEKLYKVKFDILVTDINNLRKPIIKENKHNLNIEGYTSNLEIECYTKIIEEKINNILLSNKNDIEIISLVKEILKNNNKKIYFKDILTNTLLLSFVLSLESEENFKKFINEYKVKKDNYNYIEFYEDVLKWEEEIPINTILEMLELENNNHNPFLNKLLEMKKKIIEEETESIYKIPEGIVEINYIDDSDPNNKFINNLIDKLYKKRIIMPLSLRKISGCHTLGRNVLSIKYNNEVLEIDNIFCDSKTDIINLSSPSEIVLASNIDLLYNKFKNYNITKLILTNFDNKFLNQENFKLYNIIKSFFYEKYTNNPISHYLAECIKIKQQKQFVSQECDLYNLKQNKLECEIKTDLEKIILVNKKNNEEIEISSDALRFFSTEFPSKYFSYMLPLKIHNFITIIEKIREIVQENSKEVIMNSDASELNQNKVLKKILLKKLYIEKEPLT